jgi:hypothetical protein
MRFRQAAKGVLLTAALAGCSPSIADLNLRPERHYQQKVTVKGQIARRQDVQGETLLELADARENRILVSVKGPVDAAVGDWVAATGVLVPETRVGGQSLYDVVVAEDVSSARAPFLPNLL